jgi:hypothetical protein
MIRAYSTSIWRSINKSRRTGSAELFLFFFSFQWASGMEKDTSNPQRPAQMQ